MPQLNKGDTFADGQQVTGARLNQLVDSATLLPGAITDQSAVTTNDVQAADKVIIYDDSDAALKKAGISDILNSQIPITTTTVNGVSSRLDVVNADGAVVTGATYSYVSSNIVTVTSSAHGLLANDFVSITCTSTSGDDGSKFSGIATVVSAATNTFTYRVFGTVLASSGTAVWNKSGALAINGSTKVSENLDVAGNAEINGTLSLKGTGAMALPRGTTAERPVNPAKGEIRYNTTLDKVEAYNGTEWKVVGGSPFEASGGDVILQPESTSSAATFTTANGNDITVTVTAGHTCSEGQMITLTTATAGYTGDYTVLTVAGINFTIRKGGTAGSIVTSQACTIQKTGNHKVHIFNTTGTFVASSASEGEVDVLIVGGGGGGDTGAAPSTGGGGGVVIKRGIKVSAGQSISVVVGAGGANRGSGTDSSFGSITAYGGAGGNGSSNNWRVAESGGNTEITSVSVISIPLAYASGAITAWEWPHTISSGATPSIASSPFKGIISDITNITKSYGIGRGNPSNAKVSNTGNGGYYKSSNTDVFGSSGVVIVRYPYKIQ